MCGLHVNAMDDMPNSADGSPIEPPAKRPEVSRVGTQRQMPVAGGAFVHGASGAGGDGVVVGGVFGVGVVEVVAECEVATRTRRNVRIGDECQYGGRCRGWASRTRPTLLSLSRLRCFISRSEMATMGGQIRLLLVVVQARALGPGLRGEDAVVRTRCGSVGLLRAGRGRRATAAWLGFRSR